jgi:hypothetical protein
MKDILAGVGIAAIIGLTVSAVIKLNLPPPSSQPTVEKVAVMLASEENSAQKSPASRFLLLPAKSYISVNGVHSTLDIIVKLDTSTGAAWLLDLAATATNAACAFIPIPDSPASSQP